MDRKLGIDITKLKVGTIIFVETEDDQLFELIMVSPPRGVVEVSATEVRLKQSVVGVLTYSLTPEPKAKNDSSRESFNHWIGPGLCMSLLFKNGNYESKPVSHATIRGQTDSRKWSFDVF